MPTPTPTPALTKATTAKAPATAISPDPSTGAGPDGTAGRLEDIAIGLIDPHPANDRFDVGDTTELAASIKANGLLHPLTVVPGKTAGRYLLIAGHRRLDAVRTAKLRTVACRVRTDLDTPDKQRLTMLLDNLHRRNLSPVEEARAIERLHKLAWPPERIAAQTGLSKATVRARLRLVRLPEPVLAKIHRGHVSLDQADSLIEFIGTEWYPKLENALGSTNFRWEVNSARHAREAAVAVKKARRTLTAAGTIILNDRADLTDKDYARLGVLVDAETGAPIDTKAHGSCPGHAGFINATNGDITLYCVNHQQHGHLRSYEYTAKQRRIEEAARAAAAPAVDGADGTDDDGAEHRPRQADGGDQPTRRPHLEVAPGGDPDDPAAEEEEAPPNLSAAFAETELQVATAASLRREHLRRAFADRDRRDTIANWLLVNAMLRDEDFAYPGDTEINLAIELLGARPPTQGGGSAVLLGLAEHHSATAAALIAACYETTLSQPRWLEAWHTPGAVVYATWLRRTGYVLSDFEQDLFDEADPDRDDEHDEDEHDEDEPGEDEPGEDEPGEDDEQAGTSDNADEHRDGQDSASDDEPDPPAGTHHAAAADAGDADEHQPPAPPEQDAP